MIIFRKKSDKKWVNDLQPGNTTAKNIARQFGGTEDDYEGFAVPRDRVDEALGSDYRYIKYDENEKTWDFPKRVIPELKIEIQVKATNEKQKKGNRGLYRIVPNTAYRVVIKKVDPSTNEVIRDSSEIEIIPDSMLDASVKLPTRLVNGEAMFDLKIPANKHGAISFDIHCCGCCCRKEKIFSVR